MSVETSMVDRSSAAISDGIFKAPKEDGTRSTSILGSSLSISWILGIPDDLDADRRESDPCFLNFDRFDFDVIDGARRFTDASRSARTKSAGKRFPLISSHSSRIVCISSSVFIAFDNV